MVTTAHEVPDHETIIHVPTITDPLAGDTIVIGAGIIATEYVAIIG